MHWQARPSTRAFVLLKNKKNYSSRVLKPKEKFGNTFDGVTILVTSLLLGYQKHLLSPGVILPALPYVGLEGAGLSVAQPEIVGWPFIQR